MPPCRAHAVARVKIAFVSIYPRPSCGGRASKGLQSIAYCEPHATACLVLCLPERREALFHMIERCIAVPLLQPHRHIPQFAAGIGDPADTHRGAPRQRRMHFKPDCAGASDFCENATRVEAGLKDWFCVCIKATSVITTMCDASCNTGDRISQSSQLM
jgi:hypothetical protein